MLYDMSKSLIHGDNLSLAWSEALMATNESKGGMISPAVVRFPAHLDSENIEDSNIREIVDGFLAEDLKNIEGQSVVETIANTIFPEQIWKLSKGNRSEFFQKYTRNIRLIMNHRNNHKGVYFQRMVAFKGDDGKMVNQLDHILNTWEKGNHRHSALQASIFDPRTDHTDERQPGFPCLQQIAFNPIGTKGREGLSVVAFYASQTVTEKAYGNYLGLYRLGKFMAGEMGLTLKEVICMASDLKINNNKNKSQSKLLVNAIESEVINGGE